MPRLRVRPWQTALGLALLSGVTLASFSLSVTGPGEPAADAAPRQGEMTVLTPNVYPGGMVRWTAKGLGPNETLALDWQKVQGSWVVHGGSLGTASQAPAKYTFSSERIDTVRTSATGTASGSFRVPKGFGGPHNFQLATAAGTAVAVGTVSEWPSATIAATSEPDGGFFKIRVLGLAYTPYTSDYGVLYDNRYMGFISAVTTNGTANFEVRAEGVGTHQISLRGAGVWGPYLNQEESPYPLNPRYYWNVRVTAATPRTILDAEPKVSLPAGRNLTATPTAGVVGSLLTLMGHGLPPDTTLRVVWNTESGNRVTQSMYQTAQIPLATVRTNASGAFTWKGAVPDDLGGPPHEIDVMDGTQKVGSAQFRILPKFISVSPNPAREGSLLTVHLTGVGWTEYDNIYAVDYDNAFMGYACGFNSHGDVHIQIPAVGQIGYHFIDIYPSPYMSQHLLPNWYGMPQLTYAQDHPGDTLPAFHLVIRVTN